MVLYPLCIYLIETDFRKAFISQTSLLNLLITPKFLAFSLTLGNCSCIALLTHIHVGIIPTFYLKGEGVKVRKLLKQLTLPFHKF
jgi:hypothetical protein